MAYHALRGEIVVRTSSTAKRVGAIVAVALIAALGAASALGRSAANDLEIGVLAHMPGPNPLNQGLGPGVVNDPFALEFTVTSDGEPQTVTLRFSLPSGLRFAPTPSSATEGCSLGPPVVCVVTLTPNAVGTLEARRWWSVNADALGFYTVTGTVDGERLDPNPANNTFTYRFEVRAVESGGSASVSVSSVKLKPAKPKAGSKVIATAEVTAGGEAITPSKVACTGRLAGRNLTGKGTAATGIASCRFATPKSAKGKTLKGSMAITAEGKTITKRFATKLV